MLPGPVRGIAISSESDFVAQLLVQSLRCVEEIGLLYRIELDLLSPAAAIDPDELLLEELQLQLLDDGGAIIREMSGSITQARLQSTGSESHYKLVVEPRAHRLKTIRTQDVFIDYSVAEVIENKIERLQIPVELRLVGSYLSREQITQFRESDLDFVSRLAEHVGISFYFIQSNGAEVLVATDHQAGFEGPSATPVPFVSTGQEQGITELAIHSQVNPSKYGVVEYNDQHPTLDLYALHQLPDGGAGGVIEYGPHHLTDVEAAEVAQRRAETLRNEKRKVVARSLVATMAAGHRFQLTGHAVLEDQELLVVKVEHRFEQSLGATSSEVTYENELVAVPSVQTFRPALRTPRPRIHGVVSGNVLGDVSAPESSTAHLDEHGRYIVHFHFDMNDPAEGRTSRPVRLAQPFAGPQQGMHFPLRPGTEVIVAFLDGDPDRPVIVGAVPNPLTPSRVVGADSHLHRIRSHHGLLVEFGRTNRS